MNQHKSCYDENKNLSVNFQVFLLMEDRTKGGSESRSLQESLFMQKAYYVKHDKMLLQVVVAIATSLEYQYGIESLAVMTFFERITVSTTSLDELVRIFAIKNL